MALSKDDSELLQRILQKQEEANERNKEETQKLNDQLSSLRSEMLIVKNALAGDGLGTKGVVHRLDKVETEGEAMRNELSTIRTKVGLVTFIVAASVTAFINLLIKSIGGGNSHSP